MGPTKLFQRGTYLILFTDVDLYFKVHKRVNCTMGGGDEMAMIIRVDAKGTRHVMGQATTI